MAVAAKSLEACLIEQGAVSEAIIEKARERQRDGKRLGDVLQEMGAIDGKAWAQALASHYGLPYLEQLPDDGTAAECVGVLPINFAKRYQLLPVRKDGDTVVLAAADPSALGPIDDVRVLLHKPIKVVVAPGPVIVDAINRIYDLAANSASDLMDGLDEERLELMATDFEETAGSARRRRRGADHQAGQLAALPGGEGPRQRHPHRAVRARPDGALPHRRHPLRHHLAAQALPAGHHLARQDHGRPQHRREAPAAGRPHPHQAGRQGRRHPRLDRADRVRRARRHASARPLGDASCSSTSSASTGHKLDLVDTLIHQPHGIILVTGPTGSGKTTTLYAALSRINTTDKNIITIEDPIEYQLHGVGQIQVNPKIELTFASGLRSILRQDPDVIMVGEIRDAETAKIAIQAALTGHLVFSTLHTNDSCGAITRLIDMGIEPFLVSSSVIAVMAQRLMRRVCPTCREAYRPSVEELRQLGITADRLGGQHGLPHRPGLRRLQAHRLPRPRSASTSCWSSTTRCAT